MYIVLVRHGQTEENATGRQIADSELTGLGREQAALLAERLSGEHLM
jgi:broad specificity phosphatase PhoE